MSDAQPFSFGFSGVIDRNGNLTDGNGNPIILSGFQAGVWSSWTVNLQATVGLASVTAGGSPTAGPIPIHNQGATIGPMLTYGGQGAAVQIQNGNPGEQVSGQVYGVSSSDIQDLAGNASQSYSGVGQSTSYDGQNLLSILASQTTFGGDPTFPLVTLPTDPVTYDVRNFASILLGARLISGGPLNITFRWYQNADATRLVGQRAMMLDTVVSTAIATIPNLGPFLQVVVNRTAGGNFTWNLSLVTSQRIVTDIFGGNFTPYLVEQYAQSDTNNATHIYPMGTLYGGPVVASFRNRSGSPGAITFAVDQMGTDGLYKGIGLVYNVNLGSGAEQQPTVVLPPVPCQARIVTGTTAGTYTWDVVLWTTTTGSGSSGGFA